MSGYEFSTPRSLLLPTRSGNRPGVFVETVCREPFAVSFPTMRLAFIVSHPVQYYVPIYRELGRRIRHTADGIRKEDDTAEITALKVFYTWRDAGPARDVRFEKTFAWDIPLMEGYDFEVVPNTSTEPGTHHRKGLINPDLVERVKTWKPDVVHITGYNYVSHEQAIKELSKAGIAVIFRGDSHLLDGRGPWWRWWMKKSLLSKIYRWPKGFAYVGLANRDYYKAFGVPEEKLFHVPHTIEVARFAEPNDELEAKALAWRRELGIPDDHFVFLYAAKLEPRKRPMELLDAFLRAGLAKTTLLFVGSGELESALKERAEIDQETKRLKDEETSMGQEAGDRTQDKSAEDCKLHTANSRGNVVFLEFQNQSRMPIVYRLGDVLVLPSGNWETWGLAVNEAQACGRPALVSDCVGCARDIIREGENGAVFRTDDWEHCVRAMKQMTEIDWRSKRDVIRAAAWRFDTVAGVEALAQCLRGIRQTA
ncbi:MAG: glycosyltransferase family 4 protein [Chthoniobacterales bacterium]